MSAQYTYTQTRRGDYLVRDWADRQISRHATEAEAQAAVDQLQQQLDADRAEREERRVVAEEFDAAHRDLVTWQLRWQDWRNWLYNYSLSEGRRVAARRRWADTLDLTNPRAVAHDAAVTAEERTSQALALAYRDAVSLDTTIKQARYQGEASVWETALTRAAEFARHIMTDVVYGVAHPQLPDRP